jgi:hypothetical protein
MTPTMKTLADRIDPRKKAGAFIVLDGVRYANWSHAHADLIAASDYLRTLPNPTADVADLVKRLTDYAVSDHSRGCQGRCYECTCGYDAKRDPLLDEAAAMLTLLQAQVAVARKVAVEECARWHDEQASRIAAEHPGMEGSNSQKRRRNHHLTSAAAIRALSPDPAGGMLEKVKEEGR